MNCLGCGLPIDGPMGTDARGREQQYHSYQAKCVELLRSKLNQAKEIIHELLRGGYHEGPCDNEESEGYDSCSLHVTASGERSKRADEFVKAIEGQTPCPSTYTHSSLGKLVCEKDEGHLRRIGDVEHRHGPTIWMSL